MFGSGPFALDLPAPSTCCVVFSFLAGDDYAWSTVAIVHCPYIMPSSLGSFSKGKLYILNQGRKHIMLEAFLEESFLCSEIILSGCLMCSLSC